MCIDSKGNAAPADEPWADAAPEGVMLFKEKAVETAAQSGTGNAAGAELCSAAVGVLFFAKVVRTATEQEVKALFEQYGKVHNVNLFRAYQGAPSTKGCGLITMSSQKEAAAAIEALDKRHVWQGMDNPMVVKWMDADLQRRRRDQHLELIRLGFLPSADRTGAGLEAGLSAPRHGGASLHREGSCDSAQHLHALMGTAGALLLGPHVAGERPPLGCPPDAIKLFVGNIDRAVDEQQLLACFQTLGRVVELVIVRDKATQASKGSAFVWYSTRALAERAILHFNARPLAPESAGEQVRRLVVRKAKSRATPQAGSGSPPPAPTTPPQQQPRAAGQTGVYWSQQPAYGISVGGPSPLPRVPGFAADAGMMMGHGQGTFDMPYFQAASLGMNQAAQFNLSGQSLGAGAGRQQQQQVLAPPTPAPRPPPPPHGAHFSAEYAALQQLRQDNLQQQQQLRLLQQEQDQEVHLQQQQQQHGEQENSSRWRAADRPGDFEGGGGGGYAPADQLWGPPSADTRGGGGGAGGGKPQPPVALRMLMTPQYLDAVGQHLHHIQVISGCCLTVGVAEMGIFHLLVNGPLAQAEMARSLVTALIVQAM